MCQKTLRAGAGCSEICFPESMFPTDGLRGVHDAPHVRLLVLDCGRRVAIAALELVNVPGDAIEQCKAIISAQTATALENIWIHATHAITTPHAPRDPAIPIGPPGRNPPKGKQDNGNGTPPMMDPDGPRKRKQFLAAILAATTNAARQAADSFQAAKLGIGTGQCNVNINRDIETPFGWWVGANPYGPSNKTATVLRLDGLDEKPIGFLISYGIKPCAIDNSEMDKGTRLVSSDVPGAACSLPEEKFGAPCLFVMSAAGDQVPREQAWGNAVAEDGNLHNFDMGAQKGLEIVARLGSEMAESIAGIISATVCTEGAPAIICGSTSVSVPTKKQTPIKPTKKLTFRADGGEYVLESNIIVIGDLALVAVKPETNTQTEAELQASSPYQHTLLMSMVNGGMKYMPDQASYDHITWESLSARLMPGSAEKWVSATTEKLNAMKAADSFSIEAEPPVITAIGESRPDGERIARVMVAFNGSLSDVDVNSITVSDRTILSRKMDGNTVMLTLSEEDKASFVIPQPEHPASPPPKSDGTGKTEKRGPIPEARLRPVQATVKIPGFGSLVSARTMEPVIEDFVQGRYGLLSYSLFTPEHRVMGKKYPLVMFIPDAGVNGSDPKLALAQGIGATVWAQPEEQAKRPCYVLAVQIPRGIHLTTNEHTCVVELEQIKELLDRIVATNDVDAGRIYTTGQSQGCMASCELNIRYPDYFAASLLVSGHWDVDKMTALTKQKFFFGLSSGGLREYPNFNAITNGLIEKGVKVNRIHLNFREGWEVNNARVAAVSPNDARAVYVVFDEETAFLNDGKAHRQIEHHNRGWELTYQLEAARTWLFAQHK